MATAILSAESSKASTAAWVFWTVFFLAVKSASSVFLERLLKQSAYQSTVLDERINFRFEIFNYSVKSDSLNNKSFSNGTFTYLSHEHILHTCAFFMNSVRRTDDINRSVI